MLWLAFYCGLQFRSLIAQKDLLAELKKEWEKETRSPPISLPFSPTNLWPLKSILTCDHRFSLAIRMTLVFNAVTNTGDHDDNCEHLKLIFVRWELASWNSPLGRLVQHYPVNRLPFLMTIVIIMMMMTKTTSEMYVASLTFFILDFSNFDFSNFDFSILDIRCSTFDNDIWYSTFDTQHSIVDIRYSTFNTRQSILNIWYLTFDTWHSILDIRYSPFDTQKSKVLSEKMMHSRDF